MSKRDNPGVSSEPETQAGRASKTIAVTRATIVSSPSGLFVEWGNSSMSIPRLQPLASFPKVLWQMGTRALNIYLKQVMSVSIFPRNSGASENAT